MTLIVEPDEGFAATLTFALGGEDVRRVDAAVAVDRDLDEHPDEMLVVVGPDVDLAKALVLATSWQRERPHVGMVLLRRRIDVQVLSQAMRAGIREVVSPEDLGAVLAAARRSTTASSCRRGAQQPAEGTRRRGRTVTVFAAKGGCGKTTVATNLAAELSTDGSTRVCLLDLDLEFGDVAIALQLIPERTLVDLLPMIGSMDEHGVRSVITSVGPCLDAVLAPIRPADASHVPAAVVPELLGVLNRMYDLVVIDTPPSMNENVLSAFDLSETAVLLATLDVPALKNLKLSLDTLDMLGYPKDSRLIVLNRADSRSGLELADVEKTIQTSVTVQVPSSGDVPAAINCGQLIVRARPEHPVSRALVDLAAHVRGGQPAEAADAAVAPSSPRGLRSLAPLLRWAGVR
jgi:pilus assembly protein CpaE